MHQYIEYPPIRYLGGARRKDIRHKLSLRSSDKEDIGKEVTRLAPQFLPCFISAYLEAGFSAMINPQNRSNSLEHHNKSIL